MPEGSILASDRCGRDSGKGQCGKIRREARVQAGKIQCKTSKWAVFGLKTGQRRDVPERIFANVATLKATSRRSREY